MTHWIVECDHE